MIVRVLHVECTARNGETIDFAYAPRAGDNDSQIVKWAEAWLAGLGCTGPFEWSTEHRVVAEAGAA